MWPLFFVLLIAVMLVGIASFEMLVYRLSENHYADWVKAGRPIVAGRTLFEVGVYGWLVARHRLQKDFLFRVPSWTDHDSFAYALLLVHKVSVFLFLSGTVGFLIIALLLS